MKKTMDVVGSIGAICFLVGASSMDVNMVAGTIITMVGLAMISIRAKAEGYWM